MSKCCDSHTAVEREARGNSLPQTTWPICDSSTSGALTQESTGLGCTIFLLQRFHHFYSSADLSVQEGDLQKEGGKLPFPNVDAPNYLALFLQWNRHVDCSCRHIEWCVWQHLGVFCFNIFTLCIPSRQSNWQIERGNASVLQAALKSTALEHGSNMYQNSATRLS